MVSDLDEMIHMFENVARVNLAVISPQFAKKTGIQIVSEGANLGEVVTELDVKSSKFLLDGGLDGVEGIRASYPGSFSEEDDSPERQNALTIYQIDPMDGSGDFKKSHGTDEVIGPTILVSKLSRSDMHHPFEVQSGMIFDAREQYALISDGQRVIMLRYNDGKT